MESKERTSFGSAREQHEDSASSEYEKRGVSAADINEEKDVAHGGATQSQTKELNDATAERGRSQSRRSQDGRSLKTVRSHHSRAGGDGYTCLDAEANAKGPSNSRPGPVTEQPYLVTWDGDADPENPRSMGKLRRWLINIQTMLVARFLDGLAGSAFLSVAGGTVGDMFGKHVSTFDAR
ncbi:uncharacterized protein J4E92_007364 [Alternaria infectoria]|uniref:uncharacterized protein n=1 Tax=Alternaria infectoria TaxID=45303 RepID=UPI00221EDD6C|nr:uncharacterized protein J4E92_007364 [Alternaria infectoria]KAI4924283.1 hypothetical protein J4E92_007364 [Alternaria infectoria]